MHSALRRYPHCRSLRDVMPDWSQSDYEYMSLALELARVQLGKTGDNPAVGCVIVRDGKVLGKGATGDGGRPHGEAMALGDASTDVTGATVYVTLEPCAHVSQRGPTCAQTLVERGIVRLVAALEDPDPRTSGKGFERLVAAGISVEIGLLREQGDKQIEAFKHRIGRGIAPPMTNL
jgi:diaminohydroxyphosphoribosylaminopyrimidine deaminase / 5-amino-6-(5-phosphoribosylamino)uracil reductase